MRPAFFPVLLAACSAGLTARPPADPPSAVDGAPHSAVEAPESTGATGDTAEPNQPPEADAGPDQSGLVTDRFDLDGSRSDDPDGDTLSFAWSFVDQPTTSTATITDEDRPDPWFVADRPGTYLLELAVDDGRAVSTDRVAVTVTAPNTGPVANAGQDDTVDPGDLVVLNGSLSYDPEGDPLTYEWSFASVPQGSSAFLADPGTALPNFTADVAGTYVITLVVSDGVASSSPDAVQITAREPSSGDCLSCETAATELRRRADRGQLAGAVLLFAIPVFTARWQKRRR